MSIGKPNEAQRLMEQRQISSDDERLDDQPQGGVSSSLVRANEFDNAPRFGLFRRGVRTKENFGTLELIDGVLKEGNTLLYVRVNHPRGSLNAPLMSLQRDDKYGVIATIAAPGDRVVRLNLSVSDFSGWGRPALRVRAEALPFKNAL